ncbi:hypothetical protein [Candidatus Contubernalis alkaliaceticus]|uniref:hypothetical protein n=1 Tax=Candidatus Contubernalis alkaliaceticus TaxID=338645 RepID=UPI001F4BF5AD|nr:hypothetical protein [Candidatus Contubernalis alkalaceticus]UNC92410.1 hypothetical protein HUE98_10045 [Candidatus Contubernalis alkalaceticus]
MVIRYEELLTQEVPNSQRSIAWEAKRFVEKDLQIKINIVFFRQADSGDPDRKSIEASRQIAGRAERDEFGTVWVREGLHFSETIKTIAHEGRHIWQYNRDINSDVENDAVKYEKEVASRILGYNLPAAEKVLKREKPQKPKKREEPEGVPVCGRELFEIRSKIDKYNSKLRRALGLDSKNEILEVRISP